VSGGILAEHEPRTGSANPSDDVHLPEMAPEERAAVKLGMHLWHKSKKHRAKYDKHWLDYYRFFRGDQWQKKRPSYLHSECINFIFQAIQGMVPVMTDTRPQASFLPQDPSDLEFTEVLNQLYESDWQAGNWMFRMTEVIIDSHLYSVGESSLKYDPNADFGLGRICYYSEDPLDCYPDPDANQINESEETSAFFITAKPTDVEKLRLKYKGHKFEAAIKSDIQDLSEATRDRTSLARTSFVRMTDKDLPVVREFSDMEADGNADKCLVIKVYMKPAETEEIEEEFSEGEETGVRFITKKKYPKGRVLTIINGHLFEDTPSLPNEDGKFPFQKLVNYILPREYYGVAEVEQLVSPQKIFNKLISFVLDVLTLAGNPVWLIPSSSGVEEGSFHNAPGMQIPYDGTEPPRRAEGVQLQPFVMQIIDRVENWFNGIAGSPDVSRGVNPGSVTAASAIESLLETSQTRIRQKMRNLDGYLVEHGRQYVQLALQHYTASRVFRLTNKEGVENYFKFHVEPTTDDAGEYVLDDKGDPMRTAVVTNFEKEKITGKTIPGDTKKYLIRGAFDVKVATESGLPFKKADQERRLLELFDRKIIDRREVLEKIDFPNFEKILQRVEEAEALAAQQQGA
jgi:hypothetical protein